MDMLKKFFPISFSFSDTVVNLIVGVLIYAVAEVLVIAAMGLVSTFMGLIGLGELFGFMAAAVDTLVGLYCAGGIVIAILVFCKVIK